MKAFIPAVIWASIIFALSTISGDSLPKVPIDLISPDKLAHAVVYLIFALLLMWGYHRSEMLGKKQKIMAVVVSSGFGICMEVMQYCFFPGRYFELYDIIANIIGSLSSIVLIKLFIK